MSQTNNPVNLPIKQPVQDPPPDGGGNGSGFELKPPITQRTPLAVPIAAEEDDA